MRHLIICFCINNQLWFREQYPEFCHKNEQSVDPSILFTKDWKFLSNHYKFISKITDSNSPHGKLGLNGQFNFQKTLTEYCIRCCAHYKKQLKSMQFLSLKNLVKVPIFHSLSHPIKTFLTVLTFFSQEQKMECQKKIKISQPNNNCKQIRKHKLN